MAQITLPLATKQTLNAAMERLFRSVGLPENSLGFDFAAQIDANSSGGTFTSSAANGTDAFNVTTNGARFHFGTGANDYAYSDGITVNFAGNLQSLGNIYAVGTMNPGAVIIAQSAGSDAVKVSNNGARIHFGSGASDYASSDGTTVTFAGPVAVNTFGVTNNITLGGNLYANAWTNNGGPTLNMSSSVADSSTSVAAALNTNTTWSTSGAKLLSIRNNSTEKVAFDFNGKVVLPTGGTAPVVGQATLVAGTVTVSTTAVTASSIIQVNHSGAGVLANYGHVYPNTIVAGTSFKITSTNASDTDVINWRIIN